MHDLIIIGAGGFAREIRQMIPAGFPRGSVRLKGFLSSDPSLLKKFDLPEPILDDPERYVPVESDRFLIAIGDPLVRKRVVQSLQSRGGRFLTLIHPTAYVDAGATIGEGCVVYPFAAMMNGARVGDFASLSIYSSAGHDSQIGRFCSLCPYATMNGRSVLEEAVFLGTHASVLPHRRVGEGSKVSANSAVAHDVPPRTLAFGVPAKHVPLVNFGSDG